MEFDSSSLTISFAVDGIVDLIKFCLVILGAYRLIVSLRYMLPRDYLPFVSKEMSETQTLLVRAEAINAIPKASEHRTNLTNLNAQFLPMRMESNRAAGFTRQLQLVFFSGLTIRLYLLNTKIEAIRVKIELAMDELQLATGQGATTTGLAATATAPKI
ncbi:hypothetical protein F5148DRAFT_1284520 [Russula earlei]|uniref:Uncharacterized protein n=1 Tax=Russula earlei TaxID=71964 RepID=A0ACC0UA75_9AGAM|nr:hypothetical protein F5148DRAFT_1284520 [Russula earlei]